jgi:hypothetical protein
MKHFDKEKAFDDIIKIILKAGNGESISKQMKAYSEAMEYLDVIYEKGYNDGYI